MNIKRILLRLFLLLLLLVIFWGLRFAFQYASIGSSYDAKVTCSCLFVSGRPLESIKKEDLYAVPFAHMKVDTVHKSVTADIYGFAKAKAIYRPGLGCTLVNHITDEELLAQPHFNKKELSLEDTLNNPLQAYSSLPSSIDSMKLYKSIDHAFLEHDSTHISRTRAVVILQGGKIIVERYAPGIHRDMPLLGWSMTKSITNAIIGLLVKDGKLNVNQSAPVEEWKSDERNKITLDHLMRMSSGLGFEEVYSSPSDATKMLFTENGAGKYALHSLAKFPPGTVWYYSSGTTNILQEIIRRQFPSIEAYQSFPYSRLFNKIGMHSAILEPDASGTFVGSSYMYATARDWARFGQLYLQDGIWNGERILPEGWVTYSSIETPHSGGQYAAQFWLNHHDPSFPQDAFYADGFEGQFVVIVPSKQLVIVRLGCSQQGGFELTPFVKEIVSSIH